MDFLQPHLIIHLHQNIVDWAMLVQPDETYTYEDVEYLIDRTPIEKSSIVILPVPSTAKPTEVITKFQTQLDTIGLDNIAGVMTYA